MLIFSMLLLISPRAAGWLGIIFILLFSLCESPLLALGTCEALLAASSLPTPMAAATAIYVWKKWTKLNTWNDNEVARIFAYVYILLGFHVPCVCQSHICGRDIVVTKWHVVSHEVCDRRCSIGRGVSASATKIVSFLWWRNGTRGTLHLIIQL